MQNLTKWISLVMILVVALASTGGYGYASASEPVDSCCQHEPSQEAPCDGGQEEKGCTNAGNPFQFCSCCIHAWETAQQISLATAPHPAPANYQFAGITFLPTPPASDFWQPPRFS